MNGLLLFMTNAVLVSVINHYIFLSKFYRDQQFLEKCGPDCVQYLSFQRHLIFLSTIITLTALIVVLPTNLQSKIGSNDPMQFSDTTIINLDKQ